MMFHIMHAILGNVKRPLTQVVIKRDSHINEKVCVVHLNQLPPVVFYVIYLTLYLFALFQGQTFAYTLIIECICI